MLRSADRRTAAGGQRPTGGCDGHAKVAELRTAVARLSGALAAHPADFPDRNIAEEQLAVLAELSADDAPEIRRLRGSLLLIAGAIGSVSALSGGLAQVRAAVNRLGDPRHG